jgi:predicted metal-dependent HD superfamily phosphohydrolase
MIMATERSHNYYKAWFKLNLERQPFSYRELAAGYEDPARYYHTWTHIDHCLFELDMLMDALDKPDAPSLTFLENTLSLALWYHDVVYKVTPNAVNEFESAMMFWRHAGYVESAAAKKIISLIMATTHQVQFPHDTPESWMQDIDLAGFGMPWEQNQENSRNIRLEFRHVPDAAYRRGRITVLEGFLSRQVIYNNFYFRNKYEKQARENMRDEIRQLQAGG